MERWRNVIGYEGLYQVSNLGRVRSLDRVVPHRWCGTVRLKGRILSLAPNITRGKVDALKVNLSQGGTTTVRKVHRLVLEAWVGPCPDGCEGCHNDGDPTNNIISNLRWDTHKNNGLDRRKHGTNCGRPVRRSDGVEFESLAQAAEESGCRFENIWAICNGRGKTAGGYGWEFI